ncbi:MAG: histidine kinase [Acidobacteria bacterium]|nr:histidine kinase [Acidobacteriota bacterium]
MNSFAGGRIAVAFTVAILLLIINALVSYRSVNTLIDNNERVIRTQEVLENLQELKALALQAETGARGYLLSGDGIYLDEYRLTAQNIASMIAKLKEATADNASHQQKFPALEKAIAARLERLDQRVARRQAEGSGSVFDAADTQEGKRRMDDVRAAIAEIANDEHSLLTKRVAESELSGQRTIWTFALANSLLLALLCLAFYLAIRDIRERKQNELRLQGERELLEQRVIERTAELNVVNTELQRSNRELQDFAFVASHDLQEPLRKIQAFGDRLTTKHAPQLNDEARDYLARMQGAADRMHTLINDLLSFSRVTTKAQPFVPTDLDKVAREVLVDLEVRIQENDGRVDLEKLPTIDADPLQMRQLLQNLIGNALKFHNPGIPPVIKIKAESAVAGTLSLTVTDNGIGFDEKYLDRIFTPFQRLHGRNEYEGTGIGLAVCRKIVERHGGTLTAKSKPGEGSTFIALLPVKQEKEKIV